jgi:3-(3-hydroxy-phenyl)propionate hydroxylase
MTAAALADVDPADECFDVVIVGYGPVGAVAANLFGRLGRSVAVFELSRSIYHLPRAVHFDAEIMRVFQALGLAEAVGPAVTPVRGMRFLNAEGKQLFGFDAPEGATRQGWPSGFMFYQPDLEAALRAGADALPNVSIHLEHEVVGVSDRGDHVEVRVRDLESGEVRSVRARYVLGCDGARSIVRREARLELDDLGFDQQWLVVDTLLQGNASLPAVVQQLCDPARPVTFVPSAGAHRRWEFMLLPGEDPEEMQREERIHVLLAPWIDPRSVKIIRAAVYSFHALIGRRWRNGRIFLVGDSAHQMPPFLGQGMCSGIRDAANLAWKLDLFMDGQAKDALLDSYDVEREPHVRTIVELAVSFGKIIQTTDPAVAATRDAQFLSESAKPPLRDQRMPAMPALRAGLVAPRASDEADVAGELFPQSRVRTTNGDTALLDDVLGLRFALVSVAGTPASRIVLPGALARIGAHSVVVVPRGGTRPAAVPGVSVVEEIDDVVAPWLALHGSALVRPDRYVLGTAVTEADAARWTQTLDRFLEQD